MRILVGSLVAVKWHEFHVRWQVAGWRTCFGFVLVEGKTKNKKRKEKGTSDQRFDILRDSVGLLYVFSEVL